MQFSPSLDSLTYKLSGWTGNSENGFHLCVFKWTFRHINMLTVITLFRNVSTIHYNLHSTVRCHTVNYLLMEQILYFFSSLKDKKKPEAYKVSELHDHSRQLPEWKSY